MASAPPPVGTQRIITDVVSTLSANSDVPYRGTLAEAVAEFPVGFYFKSDDKGSEGPYPGALWIYKRSAVSPFYDPQVSGEASTADIEAALTQANYLLSQTQEAATDALAAGDQVRKATWTELAAVTTEPDGRIGVSLATSGTHPSLAGDVGATGGQTPDGGQFRYTTGVGWVRLGDLESQVATTAAAAAAASAAALNIDNSSDLFYYGKRVLLARTDKDTRVGDVIADDLTHFAKYSITGTGGTAFSRDPVTGFYRVDARPTQFVTLLFQDADTFDASSVRYYNGLKVRRAWGRPTTSGALVGSIIETEDGNITIPKLSSPALDAAGSGAASLDTANYLFTDGTAAGLKQIFRTNKASGAKVQATSTGNNYSPRLSADGGKLLFVSDRSGTKETWWQRLDGARSGNAVSHPVLPRMTITPLGDSLTAAGYADDVAAAFGTTLTTPSSAPIDGSGSAGGGIGGQVAAQISARYGAASVTGTISGNTLAAGANTVAAISIAMLSRPGDVAGANRFLRAWVYKTDGTPISGVLRAVQQSTSAGGAILFETGSYYLYTFTPDTGQALGAVPNSGVVIEIDPEARQDSVLLLWMGRNNVLFANAGWRAEVKARVAEVVAAYKPLVRKIGILSITNTTSEYAGAGGQNEQNYNDIVAHNAEIAALYPDSYIDVRTAYNAGSSNDTPNPAYTSDGLHYNTAGKAVISGAVISAISAKGWYA